MNPKTTKLFILATMLWCFTQKTYGQLRVNPEGKVSIGTVASISDFITYIKGDVFMSNYPNQNYGTLYIKVGNGHPGAELGNPVTDAIAFWTQWNGFNKLQAEKYLKCSDQQLKRDIVPIVSALNKINQLKPYKYNFISTSINSFDSTEITTTLIPEYGFLSQDVELSLADIRIVEESKGIKLMDYDQIIPLLVAGMQEQQKQIEALQSVTAIMMATNENFSSEPVDGIPEKSRLISSTPNPFGVSTKLRYKLLAETGKIEIKVYNLQQGVTYKVFEIPNTPGEAEVILESSSLSQKGRYVYALFINGIVVDAKSILFE